MAMISISLGDVQPLECENCNGKFGYQKSDYIKTHYTIHFNEDGESEGGFYSDYQPLIHSGIRAYCRNCGGRLKFNIIDN